MIVLPCKHTSDVVLPPLWRVAESQLKAPASALKHNATFQMFYSRSRISVSQMPSLLQRDSRLSASHGGQVSSVRVQKRPLVSRHGYYRTPQFSFKESLEQMYYFFDLFRVEYTQILLDKSLFGVHSYQHVNTQILYNLP